ncbi:MAG: putative antitoxin [Candidatus Diapherotrites archaeon]|nr:putative antitoxin [Candidatus Diapherotrites archaeon]
MGVKTITIKDDVYKKLLAIKRKDESFSDVLERLTRKVSIDRFFGVLSSEITEEDVKKWKEERKKEWIRHDS